MIPTHWHQLTWEEIGALPAAGMDGVILPVGATEQHGPHLGCGVDTEIARQVCPGIDCIVPFGSSRIVVDQMKVFCSW